jgi:fatty acid desaturase
MVDQVIRDPTEKCAEAWRVCFGGQLCSPTFNSRGAALAYLDSLRQGDRKPEVRKEVPSVGQVRAVFYVLGAAVLVAAGASFWAGLSGLGFSLAVAGFMFGVTAMLYG